MRPETLIEILENIRKEQLNLSSTLVLLIIKQTGTPTNQCKIKIAQFSGAKLSVNIQKLVQKGYLMETADRCDNRQKILYITCEGEKFLKILLKGE